MRFGAVFEIRLDAGGVEEPGDGAVRVFATDGREVDAQGGGPGFDLNFGRGAEGAGAELPGFQEGPGPVGRGVGVEGEGGPGGGFDPRLFIGEIAPTAVGILGSAEEIEA